MDRRTFVGGAAAVALSGLSARGEEAVPVRLTLPSQTGPVMAADFLGLSYEMGQLYNPHFFSADNAALVEACRALNTNGVLRLGGHLSNITPWEGVGLNDPKQVRGVRHGIEDYWEWPLVDPSVQQNRHGMLTRQTLKNLRGFLDAVNWRLIYGFNFACGSAARAADEAVAVHQIMGPRLMAFVVGNEPDGFGDDPFFRAKGYDFAQYFAEYEAWVKAVRQRVPDAPFAGPDTDGKVDTWVLEFARRTRGNVAFLTSHYYGMGPASDPRMTAERLLRKSNPALDAEIAGVDAARQAAGGTPYRMDEGNSCFGGGRPGVSDTYASALWAADYILRAASAGFAGVNLHGGGVGVYTPIESSVRAQARPRPVYYGMQFAQRFAGFQAIACQTHTPANVTAYLGHGKGGALLAVVNKGPEPVRVELPEPLARTERLQRWELHGPNLAARNGVRFEAVPDARKSPTVQVEGYSGVILEANAG